MPVTFTSHNIVLDDGVLTRPESKLTIFRRALVQVGKTGSRDGISRE